MINFDNPLLVSICADGNWKDSAAEVSIENNSVYLTANHASWVRITWEADFSENALVLNDAWERSYGDLSWKSIGALGFSPWFFAVKENDVIHCIGVKTGPSALCSWTLTRKSVTLLMDVRCGCKDVQLDGRRLKMAELVSLSKTGDVFDALNDFYHVLCENPVLPSAPVYGGNDWYACPGTNSFESVLKLSDIVAECSKGLKNRPYQVIDAGWSLCHSWYSDKEYIGGPFRYCNDKFGDMKAMADAIKERDIKPGLWIRPLETVEYIPDEAILHRDQTVKYMDPTHPYSKEKLSEDIRRIRQWGYEMIKIDFITFDIFGKYGFSMSESVAGGDWSFYEKNKTTAEILREYYLRISNDANGTFINACNTFSHLSAGIFPVYRIGDDTNIKNFDITLKMCVNTLAFRGAMHNAFFAADADCVSITGGGIWEKNKEWLRLLSYSGTPLLVSVEPEFYSPEVREAITSAFALASEPHKVAKPIDWYETKIPRKWDTFDGIKEFNW